MAASNGASGRSGNGNISKNNTFYVNKLGIDTRTHTHTHTRTHTQTYWEVCMCVFWKGEEVEKRKGGFIFFPLPSLTITTIVVVEGIIFLFGIINIVNRRLASHR